MDVQKVGGRGRGGAGGGLRVVRCMAASDAAQLKSAREDIKEILKTTYCHPILVRIFTVQINPSTLWLANQFRWCPELMPHSYELLYVTRAEAEKSLSLGFFDFHS
jgi:hypothetical protein